jgi:hypothetical protein
MFSQGDEFFADLTVPVASGFSLIEFTIPETTPAEAFRFSIAGTLP